MTYSHNIKNKQTLIITLIFQMDKQPSPKHSDKQIQSYLQHRWFRYTVFMNELITLVTKQQLGLCSTLIYSSNTLHNDIWLWNATKLHYNSHWISSGHISEILLAKKRYIVGCQWCRTAHIRKLWHPPETGAKYCIATKWNRLHIFSLYLLNDVFADCAQCDILLRLIQYP